MAGSILWVVLGTMGVAAAVAGTFTLAIVFAALVWYGVIFETDLLAVFFGSDGYSRLLNIFLIMLPFGFLLSASSAYRAIKADWKQFVLSCKHDDIIVQELNTERSSLS